MTVSSVIVFVLCCLIIYVIGNSIFNSISKFIKKIRSKHKTSVESSSEVIPVEVVKEGGVNDESAC